jgi:hypothetical protein
MGKALGGAVLGGGPPASRETDRFLVQRYSACGEKQNASANPQRRCFPGSKTGRSLCDPPRLRHQVPWGVVVASDSNDPTGRWP